MLWAFLILGSLFAFREWVAYKDRQQASVDRLAREGQWAIEKKGWADERCGLLNRIKPETAQYVPTEDFEIPEAEPEAWFNEDGTPYGKSSPDPFGAVNGGS